MIGQWTAQDLLQPVSVCEVREMDGRGGSFVGPARQALERGEPAEAINLLEPWLRLCPDDVEAWEVIGAAYFELGRWQEAEHAARESVHLRPDSARMWRNLGMILRKAGKADEAEEALQQALSLDPDSARAQSELKRLDRETVPQAEDPSTARMNPPPPPPPPPPPAAPLQEPVPGRPPWAAPDDLDERKQTGWKVRAPDGALWGPYPLERLCSLVEQGTIAGEWGARYGSGRITTVREAIGPERYSELLRQRSETEVVEASERQAVRPVESDQITLSGGSERVVGFGSRRCPYCSGTGLEVERQSANPTRLLVIVLGVLFLPLWLALLFLKDKWRYTCPNCFMEWSENVR